MPRSTKKTTGKPPKILASAQSLSAFVKSVLAHGCKGIS